MQRVRIYYAKTGPLRYTANLDVHRLLERAFRRAALPLAYSQGFHPQPRLNQAAPLPLGFSSQAEIIDVWLTEDIGNEELTLRLREALPAGMILQRIERVDLPTPSLPTQVTSAVYRITLKEIASTSDLSQKISHLLAQSTLPRERRGKRYDLRPLIESLEITQPDELGRAQLIMQLACRPSATGRPEEVLAELGIDFASSLIERQELILQ